MYCPQSIQVVNEKLKTSDLIINVNRQLDGCWPVTLFPDQEHDRLHFWAASPKLSWYTSKGGAMYEDMSCKNYENSSIANTGNCATIEGVWWKVDVLLYCIYTPNHEHIYKSILDDNVQSLMASPSSSSSLRTLPHTVHTVALYAKTCIFSQLTPYVRRIKLSIDVHSITQHGSRLGRAMIGALPSKKTPCAKFWNLATSSHIHAWS